MIQVWLLDEYNYFTGESVFVEEVTENMTTEPLLVGYVKAKWTGEEWIEGATDEELKEWVEAQPKPAAPVKTNEELEQENKLLKAQIQALNATTEFHEELIVEMAMVVYA